MLRQKATKIPMLSHQKKDFFLSCWQLADAEVLDIEKGASIAAAKESQSDKLTSVTDSSLTQESLSLACLSHGNDPPLLQYL